MCETLGCYRGLVLAVSLAMGLAATLTMTATTHHHVVAPGALTASLALGLTMGSTAAFAATLAAALTATTHHHRVVVVAPSRAAASLAGLALSAARLAVRLAGRLAGRLTRAATTHHVHCLVQFSIVGHLVYQGERKNAPHLRQN